MRASSSRIFACLLLWAGLLTTPPAHAAVQAAARIVRTAGVTLRTVQLQLDADPDGQLHLRLHAASADLPALGWHGVGFDLDGDLSRNNEQDWLLDGNLKLTGAPGAALSAASVHLVIDQSSNTLQADLRQGPSQASAWVPLDQTTHLQIHLQRMPAGWLQGLVSTVWSGRLSAGRVDADMALDLHDNGIQSSGAFKLQGVAFSNPAGTLAGEGLGASGRVGLDTRGGPATVQLDASLRGGELLMGSLYANLPPQPVQLAMGMTADHGAIAIDRLRMVDPDALELGGALAFDAAGDLRQLRLDHVTARFPAAYERYGKAWLATMGLHDLDIRGELQASYDMRDGDTTAFAFTTPGLDMASGDGMLAVRGLHGGLDWSTHAQRPATTLAWQALDLYRLPFGPAQARWRDQDDALVLTDPVRMPLFGGTVFLNGLHWRPSAARGERVAMSLAVAGVDMAAFSKAMGWPEFPGTLGGALPSLRWVDDRVELDGGLSVHVFDGFVDITRLALQQPFGPSPVMAADISLRGLDLAAITSVFDFGNITGRMDGSIDGLRLVGWKPVAFQARLQADQGGRISQRAVNNLTSVGGGGIVAGLQGTVLRLFKTFGYKRIGLSCALAESVCRMGGLESTGNGYLIVEGSGLPHLEVIGHQRQVDWPTLVERLKAATQGGGPQIR